MVGSGPSTSSQTSSNVTSANHTPTRLPPEVITDIRNGYILTGNKDFERYKIIGEDSYEFIIGYDEYTVCDSGSRKMIGTTTGIIYYSQLSDKDIDIALNEYCGSVKQTQECCKNDPELFKVIACLSYFKYQLKTKTSL